MPATVEIDYIPDALYAARKKPLRRTCALFPPVKPPAPLVEPTLETTVKPPHV
jgi:hypothetical protein